MTDNINLRGRGRSMSTFSKIPWTLLVIIYMVVVHYVGLDMKGIAGYVFLGLGVFVLFAEFFKSGDINTMAFLVDVISAVFSVVVATAPFSRRARTTKVMAVKVITLNRISVMTRATPRW